MKNATLRQLRAFECVARHLSYSRAGAELSLTQPAVSTAVAQLESHAGQRLFDRDGHRVFLTPAGTLVLASARAIMREVRDAEEALAGLSSGGGSLAVGVISAGNYFLPGLLAAFQASRPGVRVTLAVSNRDDLLAGLAAREVDIAVMGRPPKGTALASAAFAPHPYVMVAPARHALAGRRRIPWARLAALPLLVRERGSDNRTTFDEAGRELGAALPAAMEIASNEAIKQAVIAGMGVGFLSRHTIAPELALKHLVVLDVAGLPVMRHWHVVLPRRQRVPPAAAAFRDFLAAEGAARIAALTGATGAARRSSGHRAR